MAITSAQQASIIKLVVGMFNGSPGGYMSELSTAFEAGGSSTLNLAIALSNTTAFKGLNFAYSSASTNDQFSAQFVTTLLGSAGTTATIAEGTSYVTGLLNGGQSRGQVMHDVINLLSGIATTDVTWGTASQLLANRIEVATHYTVTLSGNSTSVSTLVSTIATVDATAASVTTAEAANTSTAAAAANPTLLLTTAADLITGTNADNTITGGTDTLSNSDEIHGGLGTDTFSVRLGSANTATAPTISGVEIINITSRDASASFSFADVKGATAISVEGNSLSATSFYNSATIQLNAGFSGTLTVDINSGSVTANGLTIAVNSANTASIIAADADVLTLNVVQSAFTLGSATNATGVSALNVGGTGSLTLNLNSAVTANSLQSTAFSSLTAINAASGGALNLNIGTATTLNLSVAGSEAADTIKFYETFNNSDTVDGNGGTDNLMVSVDTALGLRANITDVEAVTFDVNTALSASFSGVVGVTTLNLRLGTAAVFSSMESGSVTYNIESAANSGAALTVGFRSAASDVVFNFLGSNATSLETTTQTATAMSIGQIALAANTGSVSFNANGSGSVIIDQVSADTVKTVTFSAGSQNMTITESAGFGTAATLNLVANSGKTLLFSNDISAAYADVSINAAGLSALVDLSALTIDNADTLTITTNSAGTGGLMFSATDITFSASTANSHASSFDIDTITINALGGDVSVGTAHFAPLAAASASLNLTINVVLGSTTATDVTFLELSGTTAIKTGQVDINVSGTGTFNINSAVFNSAGAGGVNFNVSTTGLFTASTANLSFSGLGASSILTVVLGNHAGNVLGGSGNDIITFGLSASQSAHGGAGNDEYNMSSAVNTISVASGYSFTAGTALGQDTVFNIGTGDIIFIKNSAGTAFAAAKTGTATVSGSTAATSLGTGNILGAPWTTIAFSTSVGLTIGTAGDASAIANPYAIYTSNGDTIVEVLLGTGSFASGGTSALITTANFARFVLDGKDIASVSAAFQLNSNTAGLFLTVL